jgi:Domain of unknown function (DUF4149)
MSFLRFLMLLALIVWIGGIVFFAFVEAPTLFSVLPSTRMAGDLVSVSLTKLHWMGLISGIIFLFCSLAYNSLKHARVKPFAASHILFALMLVLTAYSQFGITPRMREIRARIESMSNPSITWDDKAFTEFSHEHQLSTWTEGTILILGIGVVGLTARRFGNE